MAKWDSKEQEYFETETAKLKDALNQHKDVIENFKSESSKIKDDIDLIQSQKIEALRNNIEQFKEINAKELESIRYGLVKGYEKAENDSLEVEAKLYILKADHAELIDQLQKNVSFLQQWQHRMLALDIILFLFLLGLILFLNV